MFVRYLVFEISNDWFGTKSAVLYEAGKTFIEYSITVVYGLYWVIFKYLTCSDRCLLSYKA